MKRSEFVKKIANKLEYLGLVKGQSPQAMASGMVRWVEEMGMRPPLREKEVTVYSHYTDGVTSTTSVYEWEPE
jgi:hypothetical protein